MDARLCRVLLEFQAYADYHDMMELTERLVSGAAAEVLGTTTVEGGDEEGSPPDIDLKAPWRRVTMNDLVKEKIGAWVCLRLCLSGWECGRGCVFVV